MVPQAIHESGYYCGIYESIKEFLDQHPSNPNKNVSIFYSMRNKSFILQMGYGNLALKFDNDAFEVSIRDQKLRASSIEEIVSLIENR